MEEPLQIRSYGVVFSLERRLHRIDRFRIPLPYGLPLRSVGYGTALLLLTLVLSRLPVFGVLVSALPVPVRLAVLPAAGSYLLTRVQIDGRPAGAFVLAALRYALLPSELAGWRTRRLGRVERIGDLIVAPDVGAGQVRGPCVVLLRGEVARRRGRPRRVRLDGSRDEPVRVALNADERLIVR